MQEFDAVDGVERSEHPKSEKREEERDGGVLDISEMRFCYVYGQCQVKCIFSSSLDRSVVMTLPFLGIFREFQKHCGCRELPQVLRRT